MEFEKLMSGLKAGNRHSVIAVAAAGDEAVLKAVAEARERGIADAILCGDKGEIESIAENADIRLSDFEIFPADDSVAAARAAVSLVRGGKANMLMKGQVQTADLLRAVLDKESGLRGRPGGSGGSGGPSGTGGMGGPGDALLSHVAVVDSPILNRAIIITDGAMVPYPSLKNKVSIVENAVRAAKGLGVETPKVAPIAAVEVVNPDMPATLDAAALTVMNLRGQIRGCIIDGPLAMDLAISRDAARHKKIDSPVAGEADILLFHNIEAANSVAKTFTNAGKSIFAGIVMGASAPIVLTSRSDSDQSKLYSIACAAMIGDFLVD